MKPCSACPFNDGLTEEATIGQNYGCLPTKQDMIELMQQQGTALSCHNTLTVACVGLTEAVDTSKAKVLSYSDWYKDGIIPSCMVD